MDGSLPTGTVTFLFTDVEGSTRLWEADREAMAASLARHDDILRRVVADHGGHVFSTAGDAFSVAFESAEAAVAAAVEAQLALAEAEWPGPPLAVRMGIHTGTADERDGDYFGPTLNRAARIMAAGHGGQVLLSSVTSGLATDVDVRNLGRHRLKDLDEPEQVFELRHPGLEVVDRPLRTSEGPRHNLPEPLNSFVGRRRELDDVGEALERHRLVVLTGVGGTGKTRLAVEAGRLAVEVRPDGVWLVELAPVTDPDLVMATIGATWGLRPGEATSIEEVVVDHLADRDLLLIIDNCEHVLTGAAAAVRRLLEAAKDVTILATSRESLGVPGEVTLPVSSLSLDPDDPAHSDAVTLFVDRAQSARPGFEPSDTELEAVVRICRRIDGIPLGLELAAARLRAMTPADLADRLEESFRILSGSAKTALPRQRTLQATIDWSHDLLDPAEQAVFRRLSMFVGGFDLSAAEAVCVGDVVEDWAVIDHLDSLVDKSLVAVTHAEHSRFRMLEPIRQYAQERLQQSGESLVVLRRHADHYRQVAASASPGTRGPDQMAWDRRLDTDLDNLRRALRTLLEHGEVADHLAMAIDLYQYWMHVSLHVEAMETLRAGIAAAEDVDPALGVQAYFVIGVLGAEITDPKAVDPARAGLAIAESTGSAPLIARAHLALGAAIVHAALGPEGHEHIRAGRDLLDEHPGGLWWEPAWERAHFDFLIGSYLTNDDPGRQEHFERAIAAFERLGDRAMIVATLVETFQVAPAGEAAWAEANLRRALEICRDIHLPYWEGHALKWLGWLHKNRGDRAEAVEALALALPMLEDAGDHACWIHAANHLIECETREGVQGMGRARLRLAIDRLQGIGGIGDWAFLANQTVVTSALVLGSDGDLETARSLLGHLQRHGDGPWPEVAAHLVDELGAGPTDPHPPDSLDGALRLASTALAGST